MFHFRKVSLSFARICACTLFMVLSVLLLANQSVLACDVAVISAKASIDGRPIIWKNLDCSSYWKTELEYRPSINTKAGASYFPYHNDDYMDVLNGSPFTPQGGMNQAGFAMANAEVPEGYNPLHESLNLNTDIMSDAVQNCATLADLENYIKIWPLAHPGGTISGNFVAIDAQGGAALYEMYSGADVTSDPMPIKYKKYDANTGKIVDSDGNVLQAEQPNWRGYWNRTNFNDYVAYLEGQERYNRGCDVFAQLAASNRLSPEYIMQTLSKDVNGKQTAASSSFTNYSTTYCISRSATRSGTVIEGVASGSDPRLTTMWNALGEPSLSVYTPTIAGAGAIGQYTYMDAIAADGTMSDSDDSCLLNIAEDKAETGYGVYSSNRGNSLTAMDDKTMNKTAQAQVQAFTLPIEATVLAKTNELLDNCRTDSSLITANNLYNFTNYCSKYIYQNYAAGSSTAVSWNYTIPSPRDTTVPTASIAYSTSSATNGSVAATLTNPSEPITITNNSGSASYTFTQNGSFTFQFKDAAGNIGTAKATVTWIDKTAPTASITYNPSAATNGSVVATLSPSESVTVTNNSSSTSYTFTQNGSFTFQFKDAAGNTGTATATVTWINKTAPTARVSYSPSTATNGSVVATLTNPSTTITMTNNSGLTSYTFTQNGSFTFQFKDSVGNTGSATATVTWIDKTAPTATITYSPSTATNGNVVATLSPSESVTVINNGGLTSYTFTQNGSFTFQFRDAAGNTGTATAAVTWITPAVAPTASIAYSPSTTTNGNVVAALTNPSTTITVTNNGGSTSYTFTQNGSFTFQFRDSAGRTGTTTATVTWIDKTAPTASITYDPYTSTSGNVVASLSPSESITVTNNGGSASYTFTQNGSFTFQFKDAAGNIGTATATVTWITSTTTDTTPPTASISYSTTSQTTGSVVASLVNPSEAITVTNNSGSTTYTFSQNGSFTFQFKDAAGNTGTATATVTWITSNTPDTTPPTASVSYSTTSQTTGSVVASLVNPSEAITIINNGGSTRYTFTQNGSFTFYFRDAAGNTGTATATVTWIMIDTTPPTASISYSTTSPTTGSVVASLVNPSEAITVVNNGGSTRYTFTQNGSYTFYFRDAAGNTGSATASVNWIQRRPGGFWWWF